MFDFATKFDHFATKFDHFAISCYLSLTVKIAHLFCFVSVWRFDDSATVLVDFPSFIFSISNTWISDH